MLIRVSVDSLFLQYYTMFVLVHVLVDPGKKLYFYYPYSYAYKLCLYSNTYLDLFIRAFKIHALVRKCLSSSYLFCGHFQNWMTKRWEFQASFTSGAKEKKKEFYILSIFISNNEVLDFEEGYFYPQEIIFFRKNSWKN